MAPDFHQFRGKDAGRTVIGGKGFIQLGHHTANADPVFHEVDFHPGIGKVQRRLNTGDTRTDNHYCTDFFVIF